MQNDIIFLLTGTINTGNKDYTVFADTDSRKSEYIDTIRYYLSKYHYPVVFVENSGEDISSYFVTEINLGQLEILTFYGNEYSQELGKGLGELYCIEHALKYSKVITESSFLFKITGRYRILNLKKFIHAYKKNEQLELLADLTNNFRFSQSGIFGFRPFFAQRYLFKNSSLLNDSNGFYFEHGLAKAVLEAIGEGIRYEIFKTYPAISAISGTTGKKYKKSFFYMLPRHIKYLIRYYIVIR